MTATGVVMFYWDSGDDERHMLVNIEPDDHRKPAAFELIGAMRDAVVDEIEEGAQIAIDYLAEHHELVDPDGATTHDTSRLRVVAVRIEGP